MKTDKSHVYTLIQELNGSNETQREYYWDPAAGVATRPLMLTGHDCTLYYTHDANKNVTELMFHATGNGIGAHYEYSPFGITTAATSNTTVTGVNYIVDNHLRFSSEYYDYDLALIYYNYRHYNPLGGRFLNRDPIEEFGGINLYGIVGNSTLNFIDIFGFNKVVISGGPNENREGWEIPTLSDELFLSFLFRIANKIKSCSHDRQWLNYIIAAEQEIIKLQETLPQNEDIEWFIYKPGYVNRAMNDAIYQEITVPCTDISPCQFNICSLDNQSYISLGKWDTRAEAVNKFYKLIENKAKTLNVKLRYFNSKEELLEKLKNPPVCEYCQFLEGVFGEDYMNYIGYDCYSKNTIITSIAYFGHGSPGKLWLSYNAKGDPASSITIDDINHTNFPAENFDQSMVFKSYACNSTTVFDERGISFQNAWLKLFKNHKFFGVKGKTDYIDPKNPGLGKNSKWCPCEP